MLRFWIKIKLQTGLHFKPDISSSLKQIWCFALDIIYSSIYQGRFESVVMLRWSERGLNKLSSNPSQFRYICFLKNTFRKGINPSCLTNYPSYLLEFACEMWFPDFVLIPEVIAKCTLSPLHISSDVVTEYIFALVLTNLQQT